MKPVSSNLCILEDLKKKLVRYNEKAELHKNVAALYRNIYYLFGMCCVILSVIVISLSATQLSSTFSRIIFALGTINGTITCVLNFLGIEKRVGDHQNAHVNYMHLARDLEADLLHSHSDDDKSYLDTIYASKEKIIMVTEPSLNSSLCCSHDTYIN